MSHKNAKLRILKRLLERKPGQLAAIRKQISKDQSRDKGVCKPSQGTCALEQERFGVRVGFFSALPADYHGSVGRIADFVAAQPADTFCASPLAKNIRLP